MDAELLFQEPSGKCIYIDTAMADAELNQDLLRDSAETLAAQNGVRFQQKWNCRPRANCFTGKVASPAGTVTIEAIHVLEKQGFSGLIRDAIEAAFLKSRTLGGK
jgi:pyrroline-5-carboxylate reductase